MKTAGEFYKVSESRFISDAEAAGFSDAKAAYQKIVLPKRATRGSAGYDFFLPFHLELKAGDSVIVPTGVCAKINDGFALFIFPKSGLGFNFRLQLDNTVGIVDTDYFFADNEGHIMIKIGNNSREGKTLSFAAGKGFAQGVFLPFGITESDDAKAPRRGGFGSTEV